MSFSTLLIRPLGDKYGVRPNSTGFAIHCRQYEMSQGERCRSFADKLMEGCSTIDTSIPMPRISREDPQEFYPAAIALVLRELPYVMENSKERPPAALNLHAGQEIYQYSELHGCYRVARRIQVQDMEATFFPMMASHILQLEATQQASVDLAGSVEVDVSGDLAQNYAMATPARTPARRPGVVQGVFPAAVPVAAVVPVTPPQTIAVTHSTPLKVDAGRKQAVLQNLRDTRWYINPFAISDNSYRHACSIASNVLEAVLCTRRTGTIFRDPLYCLEKLSGCIFFR
jgi:hypothetical protein